MSEEEKENKGNKENNLPPFCKKKKDGSVEVVDNKEERSGRDQDKEDIMQKLRDMGYM